MHNFYHVLPIYIFFPDQPIYTDLAIYLDQTCCIFIGINSLQFASTALTAQNIFKRAHAVKFIAWN